MAETTVLDEKLSLFVEMLVEAGMVEEPDRKEDEDQNTNRQHPCPSIKCTLSNAPMKKDLKIFRL